MKCYLLCAIAFFLASCGSDSPVETQDGFEVVDGVFGKDVVCFDGGIGKYFVDSVPASCEVSYYSKVKFQPSAYSHCVLYVWAERNDLCGDCSNVWQVSINYTVSFSDGLLIYNGFDDGKKYRLVLYR
jgi:hypothetical protein